jgi:hypothetical protein
VVAGSNPVSPTQVRGYFALIPFAHYAYRLYKRMWPEIDRRVLDDPEVAAIFVDDMVNAFRGRCLAMVDDARLLGRDWGFRLVDVKVPVRWWHGETDQRSARAYARISLSHNGFRRSRERSLTFRLTTAERLPNLARGPMTPGGRRLMLGPLIGCSARPEDRFPSLGCHVARAHRQRGCSAL